MNILKTLHLAAAGFWLLVSGASLAEPLEANFVAVRVPVHLESDHSGQLAEVHRWLMQQADISAELVIMPRVRATKMLESRQVDGLYPAWVPSNYKLPVLFSSPLLQTDFFIFTAPQQNVISKVRGLAGKRLGLVKSYNLKLDFSDVKDLVITYASNSKKLISMLSKGRVDAVILGEQEAETARKSLALPPLRYNAKAMLLRKYLGYCFINNEKGVQLQKRINAVIYRAQKSGDLAKHFGNNQAIVR